MPARKTEQHAHRGRFQAQGGGIEESVAWAQDEAPTVSEGQNMLDLLWNKLNTASKASEENFFNEPGTISSQLVGRVV